MPAEHDGERDGVLECLIGALPEIGRHRVCRVAEQDDPPAGEGVQGGQIVDVVTEDSVRVDGIQHRGNRIRPRPETALNFGEFADHAVLTCRCIGGGEQVGTAVGCSCTYYSSSAGPKNGKRP
ncbi:hypothetical protein [Nocardia amikacinitolerans]|uniref:hypothetical protein n=1 Tax=Nocardia amikacinitolerans TaxID=756689 RepID=UPI001FE3428C|nr:hypothetical protein [Nocardia amikacinitolerans]